MTGYLEILSAVLIWAFFNGVLVKGIKTSGVGVGMWTGIVGIIFCFAGQNMWSISYAGLGWYQIIILIHLGIFCALNNSFNYTGIKISIPVALMFHYLAPLLVFVWIFLFPILDDEPIHTKSILALGIGLVGMIYMAHSHLKEGSKKLVLLGMASAVFYSLEIVFSGYLSKKLHVPAQTSTFTKLAFQAMIMPLVGIWPIKESARIEKVADVGPLILGGVLLYGSFILYFAGSALIGPIERGILGYIDRIGAIALGAYFFKEERAKITKEVWIGGALILGAGLMIII